MSNYLTEGELAKELSLSLSKLQKDRQMGIGIRYIKFHRSVRYSASGHKFTKKMDTEDLRRPISSISEEIKKFVI